MRKNAFSPPIIILYLLLFLNDYLLADIFGGGTDEEGEGALDRNELMTCLIPEGIAYGRYRMCQRSKTINKKACVLLFYIFVLFYGFLSFVGAKIRIFFQCAH